MVTTRILATVLAATMALAASIRPAAAQETENPRVTLRVRNDAQVPGDLLDTAMSAVTAIFTNAGIDATFVDARADFMIVLLSRQNADKMHQIPDAVGFAPGSETARGTIAYVLQPRVEKIADGYSTGRMVVLAAAIAHEVGHLLLFSAHSSTGIMRAEWNQADFRLAVRGNLLFTPEQAAKMRATLSENERQAMVVR